MKYFIDFEATQFSGEVISIGCVDENGREFYTLVKPAKIRNLTDFILELTHISADEIAAAPTADEAFTAFLEWLDPSRTADFYCYGDSDALFLLRTRRHLKTFRAQLGLSMIRGGLYDFSADMKKHFSLKTSIALKKVVAYYRGGEVEQTHNSLADAQFLKEVYEKTRNDTVKDCPFPEYQRGSNLPKIKKLIRAVKGNVRLEFTSYGRAADWVMSEQLSIRDTVNGKTKSKVCSRIITAAEKERPYCGFDWSVENPPEGETMFDFL